VYVLLGLGMHHTSLLGNYRPNGDLPR